MARMDLQECYRKFEVIRREMSCRLWHDDPAYRECYRYWDRLSDAKRKKLNKPVRFAETLYLWNPDTDERIAHIDGEEIPEGFCPVISRGLMTILLTAVKSMLDVEFTKETRRLWGNFDMFVGLCVHDNMNFIRSVAAKIAASKGYPMSRMDDLIQEGIIGMIDGIDRTDLSKGASSTIIWHRVRYMVGRYIDKDNSVSVPINRSAKDKGAVSIISYDEYQNEVDSHLVSSENGRDER